MNEQHVVTADRFHGIGRSDHVDAAAIGGEVQLDVTLALVEAVRGGAQANQRDLGDCRCRVDVERFAVSHTGRDVVNGRLRSKRSIRRIEVRRRENLHLGVVGCIAR